MAALQDETADASIVNTYGSSAVNVYLGIGIAWSLAAIYHTAQGDQFLVEPGSLGMSVVIVTIGGIVSIALLQWRRYSKDIKGELGGPITPKVVITASFVLMWFLYMLIVSFAAYCIVSGF